MFFIDGWKHRNNMHKMYSLRKFSLQMLSVQTLRHENKFLWNSKLNKKVLILYYWRCFKAKVTRNLLKFCGMNVLLCCIIQNKDFIWAFFTKAGKIVWKQT